MIESYFAKVEQALQAFPSIRSYTLKKKVYNSKQGYIGGSIIFENRRRLDKCHVPSGGCQFASQGQHYNHR